jgi:hypothetical protein
MALLSKTEILSADDRKFEDVPVPEWGGTVRVAVMSGAQRDVFEGMMLETKDRGAAKFENFRARMAVACLVNENFDPVFTLEDIEKLSKKSGAALSRVFAVALRLNAITGKDVDELVGNSKPSQGDGSISV